MHHYDDLQRFKDKTRTDKIDFRDLSSQNLTREQGNWSIVNQLAGDSDATLFARAGHVSLPAPQPVSPDAFVLNGSEMPVMQTRIESVESASPSILQDIAAQTVPRPLADAAPDEREPERPTHRPAVAPANYSRLFAPVAAETSRTSEKNQPLQSLLERIASCR